MAITTIDQARQAIMLQEKIDVVTSLQSTAAQAKAGNWQIGKLVAIEPNGAEHPLISGALDDAASQAAIDYCLTVYAQMLAALTAQLAALLA